MLAKAVQKELKRTAKWAEHEIHTLPKQHRRFVHSLHEAIRLDRWDLLTRLAPHVHNPQCTSAALLLSRTLIDGSAHDISCGTATMLMYPITWVF
jgi:hypothetical protein